jgi:type IV secretory pathway VirB10-like protein
MQGRVLNFLEFSDKYSTGSTEPATVDDIANAASNFEEGFDETTYDQPEIKANRPVSGEYEMTPATPGSEGAPSFSADNTEDMNAPEETPMENQEEVDHEESESPAEESAEHAEGGSEEDEEEDEDEEDIEEGNPEAGANPKKKVEEGFTLVKGFEQFVNEAGYVYLPKEAFSKEGYYADNEGEEEDEETCPDCGEVPLRNEYGVSCGCNM